MRRTIPGRKPSLSKRPNRNRTQSPAAGGKSSSEARVGRNLIPINRGRPKENNKILVWTKYAVWSLNWFQSDVCDFKCLPKLLCSKWHLVWIADHYHKPFFFGATRFFVNKNRGYSTPNENILELKPKTEWSSITIRRSGKKCD